VRAGVFWFVFDNGLSHVRATTAIGTHVFLQKRVILRADKGGPQIRVKLHFFRLFCKRKHEKHSGFTNPLDACGKAVLARLNPAR